MNLGGISITGSEDDDSTGLADSGDSTGQIEHGRELVKYSWEGIAIWSSSRSAIGSLVALVPLLVYRAWFSTFAARRGSLEYVVIDEVTYWLMLWLSFILFGYVVLRIHHSLQEAELSQERTVLGRLKCPHCGALYLYSESSIDIDDTVECQNCATRFAVPETTPSDW